MLNVPSGTIALWRNPIASIPPTWKLCDGSLGTPDLRDRFLVGSGSTYNPGDSGGSVNHVHTFTSDGHQHDLLEGDSIEPGIGYEPITTSDIDTGTTDSSSNLPPYYSLAFIQKI